MGFLVPVLNFFAILALLLPHRGRSERRGGLLAAADRPQPPDHRLLRRHRLEFLQPAAAGHPRAQPAHRHRHDPAPGPVAIGGSFSLEKLKGDLVRAGFATGIKLLWLPLLAALLLHALGVRGLDLGIGVLMAGTPAATATYIMAHQMKGDAELAGSIVMLSTLLSAATYTVALYFLHTLGI